MEKAPEPPTRYRDQRRRREQAAGQGRLYHMKTIIVNPENAPRKNGTEPEAMQTKRSTERNSRPELLTHPERLQLVTHAGINKLYALQWDITSFRLYKEARQNAADIAGKAWLALYEAEQEQSEEKPIFTIIRAIRAWIRETRSNGVSYNETTEDAEGNTVERWNQQPAHNNTEAEALHRFALIEAAEYITSTSRIKTDRETLRQFLELVSLYDYPPRRAAAALKIQCATLQNIMNKWSEYKKAYREG